jgi:hypothetical protein
MSSPRRLAFHEMMGRLGVGDLHPGGRPVSSLFQEQLLARGARRVLEVGAGIGVTTERLLNAGFDVAPLEPNPVLRGVLTKRLGIRAHDTTFEDFDDRDGSYDAVRRLHTRPTTRGGCHDEERSTRAEHGASPAAAPSGPRHCNCPPATSFF